MAAFSWVTFCPTRSPTTTTPEHGNADLQRHVSGYFQGRDGFQDGEAGKDRPLRIVLVWGRIAEICKYPSPRYCATMPPSDFTWLAQQAWNAEMTSPCSSGSRRVESALNAPA